MTIRADLLTLASDIEKASSVVPVMTRLLDLEIELEDALRLAKGLASDLETERDLAEKDYKRRVEEIKGKSHADIMDAFSGGLLHGATTLAKVQGAAKRMHEQASMLENILDNVRDTYRHLGER